MTSVALIAVPKNSPRTLPQGLRAPGSFTLPTGRFAIVDDELELTGSQEAVLEGTAALNIL